MFVLALSFSVLGFFYKYSFIRSFIHIKKLPFIIFIGFQTNRALKNINLLREFRDDGLEIGSSQQKHNFRSWLNSRQRKIEVMKWEHADTAHLIVCAPTWERGGSRQLPRSGTQGRSAVEPRLRNMFHSTPYKSAAKKTPNSILQNTSFQLLHFVFRYFEEDWPQINFWKIL